MSDLPTITTYDAWVLKELDIDLTLDTQIRQYDNDIVTAKSTVTSHPFFQNLAGFVEDCCMDYKDQVGADLLMNKFELSIVSKTYKSSINKSYRMNIVLNKNLPGPPSSGWISPENWYEELNDLLRTRITCKFIDGPQYLSNRLTEYAATHGLDLNFRSQQKDGGYYAYHCYVHIDVPLLKHSATGRVVYDVKMSVEIQLTTQLQEVLYDLTHPIYEALRVKPEQDPSAWKWDYKSDRFKSGYMGHTLHMLEAIILEIRDNNITSAKVQENEDVK